MYDYDVSLQGQEEEGDHLVQSDLGGALLTAILVYQ